MQQYNNRQDSNLECYIVSLQQESSIFVLYVVVISIYVVTETDIEV